VAVVAKGGGGRIPCSTGAAQGGRQGFRHPIASTVAVLAGQIIALPEQGIDAADRRRARQSSQMLRAGVAVRFAGLSKFYAHEAAHVLYSGNFLQACGPGGEIPPRRHVHACATYDRALKDAQGSPGPGKRGDHCAAREMDGVKDLSIFRDAVRLHRAERRRCPWTVLQTDLDYYKELACEDDLTSPAWSNQAPSPRRRGHSSARTEVEFPAMCHS